MDNEILSLFTATSYKTGKKEEVCVEGSGQDAVNEAMKEFPRHTKFVLDGFKINGKFVPLHIKSRYYDRY